jgi:hypothetical protein
MKPTPPKELPPIETASRDELRAVQLKGSNGHCSTYDNVPNYRGACDAIGVTIISPPLDLVTSSPLSQTKLRAHGAVASTMFRS